MSSALSDSQPPGDLYCPTCERTYFDGVHCPEDGTRLVRIKPQVDPLLGRNLDNRYTIVEKLGQGGMGAVYRGTQHSVGREVAIKVINAHLVAERDAIKRFLREAKLASRLAHPNAVSVLEFGQTEDGLLYLVMELVTGRTLDQVIKREGTLKPERVVRIGMQVCDALEGAHALQIVHRDLKPANIMLLAQGRDLVKVLDFGLAKSVAPDQASTTMTNAGALLGTPAYMPPELALGSACDGRADLYSLGVILYLLGTGSLPFVSESAHELIALHGHEPAPPMMGVPPGLAAVVDRLLAKRPEDRFQSAAQTREALDAALGPRMVTPATGLSGFTADTNPSLGPFPATPQQFAHLRDTPTPKRPSSTAIHKLVTSDTIAVLPATATSMVDPSASPGRTRRWLVPVLAVAVLAAGAGAVAMMRKGSNAAGTSPAATPAPTTQPAAAVHEPAPPVTPPAVTPPPVTPSVAAGSGSASPAIADTEKPPTPAAGKADPRPTKKPEKHTVKTVTKSTTKPTTKPATTLRPTTGGINPTSSQGTAKPAAGAGSASPNKGLPF